MAAALASSCDSDSDSDEIGAQVYRTSRTAQGLAEDEEEAVTSEPKAEEEEHGEGEEENEEEEKEGEEGAAVESRPRADPLPVDTAARASAYSELGTTGLAEGPPARERDAKRPRTTSGGEGASGERSAANHLATTGESYWAEIKRAVPVDGPEDDGGPDELTRKNDERLMTKLNQINPTLEDDDEGRRAEKSPILDDLAGLAREELIRKMDERLMMMLDQIADGRAGAAPAKWRNVEESRREGIEGIVVADGPLDPVEGEDGSSCPAWGGETAKKGKEKGEKSKGHPNGAASRGAGSPSSPSSWGKVPYAPTHSPDGPGGADQRLWAGPWPPCESARTDGEGRRGSSGPHRPRRWTTLQRLLGLSSSGRLLGPASSALEGMGGPRAAVSARMDVVANASRRGRRRRERLVWKRDYEAEGSSPPPPGCSESTGPNVRRRTRRHPHELPRGPPVDPRDGRDVGGGGSPPAPDERQAGCHDERPEFRPRREDSPDQSAHRHLPRSELVRNPPADHGRGRRRRRVENLPRYEEEARRPIEERRLEGGGRRPISERSVGIESGRRPRTHRRPHDGLAEGAKGASLLDERPGEGPCPRSENSPGRQRIQEGLKDSARHHGSTAYYDDRTQAYRFEHARCDEWDGHGGQGRGTPAIEHGRDAWDRSTATEEFAPTRHPTQRHPAEFSHDRHDRPCQFDSEQRYAPWEWRDETRTTSPLGYESQQDRPREFESEEGYSPWEWRDETRTASPLDHESHPPWHERLPASHPPSHDYYHYHFHHYPPHPPPAHEPQDYRRGPPPPPPSAYGPPPPIGPQAPPPHNLPPDDYRCPPSPDYYRRPSPAAGRPPDYHPQHAHTHSASHGAHPASHGAPPYHPSHPPPPDYYLPPHVGSSQGPPHLDSSAGPHDAYTYHPPPPSSFSYSR